MQNLTPLWSLWYPSYAPLNSMYFWSLLFLLLFLSSSLWALNLNSQTHMSMTVMWQTEQVYVSPGSQTELLPVMSVSFRVNFDSIRLWVKRNLLCLGSRGGRLRKMRTAAHSRKCLWEIQPLRAKRISFLRCTWGNPSQGTLSFRRFGKNFQTRAKRR